MKIAENGAKLSTKGKIGLFCNSVFCEKREKILETDRDNDQTLNEHKCDRQVKLAEYDQLPIVFLNSFPGSGNT